MDHFLYRNGQLHAEDVPLAEIAAEVGTPFYCYSTATLLRHFTLVDQSFQVPHARHHVASKPCLELEVLEVGRCQPNGVIELKRGFLDEAPDHFLERLV